MRIPYDNAARLKVARCYAKSVAVIDDDIVTEEVDGRERLDSHFVDLRNSCTAAGVLCHLHPFPKNVPFQADNDDYIKAHEDAVRVGEAADVIVLDWFLATSKGGTGYAMSILEKLIASKRVRFIFIYSNDPPADISDHLISSDLKLTPVSDMAPTPENEEEASEEVEEPNEENLSGRPQDVSESSFTITNEDDTKVSTEPDASSVTADGEGLRTMPTDIESGSQEGVQSEVVSTVGVVTEFQYQNHVFISIRNKRNVVADSLLRDIQETLSRTFKDALHWASLEIASRMRDLMPKITAKLPSETDGSLFFQLIYQRPNELAAQIAEVLLDEVRFDLLHEPLSVVRDDVVFDAMKHHMVSILKDANRSEPLFRAAKAEWFTSVQNAMRTRDAGTLRQGTPPAQLLDLYERGLESLWEDATIEQVRTAVDDANGKLEPPYFVHSNGDDKMRLAMLHFLEETTDKIVVQERSATWAALRETVLMFKPDSHVWPGYVLRRIRPDDSIPEWLLCITPACDCNRSTGHGYLFVAGKTGTDTVTKSKAGETQTSYAGKHIIWDAAHLIIRLEPIQTAENGEKDYEFATVLRYDNTMRIINRVWAHQTRVGVDTAEYTRFLRKE